MRKTTDPILDSAGVPINFVVVRLGDNDFGWRLGEALRDLVDEVGGIGFCPELAKAYIVNHVAASSYRTHLLRGGSTEYLKGLKAYLQSVRVEFRERLPTDDPEGNIPLDDDDGGSVYYDVNLDKVSSI